MSEFLSPLDERLIDPFANDGTGLWQLLAPFHYYSSRLKRRVEIPLGLHMIMRRYQEFLVFTQCSAIDIIGLHVSMISFAAKVTSFANLQILCSLKQCACRTVRRSNI